MLPPRASVSSYLFTRWLRGPDSSIKHPLGVEHSVNTTAERQTGWNHQENRAQGQGSLAVPSWETLPHPPPPASSTFQKLLTCPQWDNAAKPQTHRKPGLSPPDTATSSAEGDLTLSASQRTRERKWPRGGSESGCMGLSGHDSCPWALKAAN